MQQLEQTRRLVVEQGDPQLLIDIVIARLKPQLLNPRHLIKLDHPVLEFLNDEDGNPWKINTSCYSPLAFCHGPAR